MKKILLSLIISITTCLGATATATATANANTTVPKDLATCCHKISDDSEFKTCMQTALQSDIQETKTKREIKICASNYLSKDYNCLATYAKHQNNNARIMYKTDNKTYKFDMKITDVLPEIKFPNGIAFWLYNPTYNRYPPTETITRDNLKTTHNKEVWWHDQCSDQGYSLLDSLDGDTDLAEIASDVLEKIDDNYSNDEFSLDLFWRPEYFPGTIIRDITKGGYASVLIQNFSEALGYYNELQKGLKNSDNCNQYDLYMVTGDTKTDPTQITILYGPYLN